MCQEASSWEGEIISQTKKYFPKSRVYSYFNELKYHGRKGRERFNGSWLV